jgi:hypothetical protein
MIRTIRLFDKPDPGLEPVAKAWRFHCPIGGSGTNPSLKLTRYHGLLVLNDPYRGLAVATKYSKSIKRIHTATLSQQEGY